MAQEVYFKDEAVGEAQRDEVTCSDCTARWLRTRRRHAWPPVLVLGSQKEGLCTMLPGPPESPCAGTALHVWRL